MPCEIKNYECVYLVENMLICWLLCSLQLNFGHIQTENTVNECEFSKKSA
jgi:hypothetical protein